MQYASYFQGFEEQVEKAKAFPQHPHPEFEAEIPVSNNPSLMQLCLNKLPRDIKATWDFCALLGRTGRFYAFNHFAWNAKLQNDNGSLCVPKLGCRYEPRPWGQPWCVATTRRLRIETESLQGARVGEFCYRYDDPNHLAWWCEITVDLETPLNSKLVGYQVPKDVKCVAHWQTEGSWHSYLFGSIWWPEFSVTFRVKL